MYVSQRAKEYEQQTAKVVSSTDKPVQIDKRLEAVVERIFKRCYDDKEFKQAIGIALESRRLDVVQSAIKQGDPAELLKYTLKVSNSLIQNLDFRNKVLRMLVELYKGLKEPDYITVGQCLVWLDDPEAMKNVLESLVAKGDQVCFYVYLIELNHFHLTGPLASCIPNCI